MLLLYCFGNIANDTDDHPQTDPNQDSEGEPMSCHHIVELQPKQELLGSHNSNNIDCMNMKLHVFFIDLLPFRWVG